jgi:HPt (histidine-containing phosphotransfer) domain-containing protein
MDKRYTDLTHLKELAEGSNEFIIEMIDGFLVQTPEILEKMKICLIEKNWNELRALAHKMNPSVDFIGIHVIRETVKKVEKYAGEQIHIDQLPDLVNEIINVCSAVLIELKSELKNFQ